MLTQLSQSPLVCFLCQFRNHYPCFFHGSNRKMSLAAVATPCIAGRTVLLLLLNHCCVPLSCCLHRHRLDSFLGRRKSRSITRAQHDTVIRVNACRDPLLYQEQTAFRTHPSGYFTSVCFIAPHAWPNVPSLLWTVCQLWLFLAISWAALNYVLFIHDLCIPGKRPVIFLGEIAILPWYREQAVTRPNCWSGADVLGPMKHQKLLQVSLVQDHVDGCKWWSCAVIRHCFQSHPEAQWGFPHSSDSC